MTSRRDLDLATLRSFVTIAELGSMTRAANKLHMTQSAVSMQIKRLEDSLSISLFERSARGMAPTPSGDQLLHYANQLLALNDEAWGKLTAPDHEGLVSLGVPVDIISPHIPKSLAAFNRAFPRIHVQLTSSRTTSLLRDYQSGVHDVVLTTERQAGEDGIVLANRKLVWTSAIGGNAWHRRPLPIGFSRNCFFRQSALQVLDENAMPWINMIETDDDLAGYAMVAADLCITAELEDSVIPSPDREIIQHTDELPLLPEHYIVMYCTRGQNKKHAAGLAEFLREQFR